MNIIRLLVINEHMDFILFRDPLDEIILMLEYPSHQVVRYADVERALLFCWP